MSRYRKLLNPENSEKTVGKSNVFYLLSVDVGRLSCQTVVSVFKVYIRKEEFHSSLVNIIVLGKTPETKHFEIQSLELKKIIQAFNPVEVVVDGNGLGVGLLDYMVKPHYDGGVTYPAYCATNDKDYSKNMYKDAIPLLFVIKANASSLNSEIHSNCFNKVNSGKVSFLVKEQAAKIKLLSTKKGQKMSPEKRIARLMPHEMTTRLFEEMSNLKLKSANPRDIVLEQIDTRKTKDKFSSFEYGLYRIREREEEYYRKKRRGQGKRKLVFFN